MQIKRLELKAFGHFTDRNLDFSSDMPGLHVVYGRNEAGKSSSLRALQALFFGFPARSADNFLHSYDQLLVKGCLQGSDGNKLTFARRKKNKNSLFDEHDNPLNPALLYPFLHGLEQDLFTTLYGINHETLVKGGQGILDQQGEVGQALFSAGTGLASLKTIVDELEAEGDNLFRPRGSSQAITSLVNQYKELQSQLKQVTLSSREWQDHQRVLDDAVKKLEGVNELRSNLTREKRQLERLKQALPYLGQCRNILDKLADLGDVVVLPTNFGDRRRELEQQARETRNNLETDNSRLKDLEDKRNVISFNQSLLDHFDAIESLHQELGQYRKAKADRPQLEGRRIGSRTDAANLLKQIRPELSINDVESLRPSLSKRKTIQTLGTKHEALVLSLHIAERQVQSTTKEHEKIQAECQQLAQVTDVKKLSQSVMLVQKVGDLDGEITTKRQSLKHAQKSCNEALQRLGLWSGSLEMVGQLAIPLPETAHRFEEEFRSCTETIRQLLSDREQQNIELAQIVEQLHEIEFSAEVPTEEELNQFRGKREHGWQLLRRQWLQGEDVSAESHDYDPEQPLPDAYQKMVGISDQTADRMYREADRVQKHASFKARAKAIENRLYDINAQLEKSDSALRDASRRWQELWAPCSIIPLPPREMQAWLNNFEKIRFQAEETGKITKDIAERETKRTELRAILAAELAMLGEKREFPGKDLSTPLLCAEELLHSLQNEQSHFEMLERKRRDLESALEAACPDRDDAADELRLWQALWEDAVTPLGIESKTIPAEAIDFIETLQSCFDKLKEADDFRKRIEGIDRDSLKFEESVMALVKDVAPDISEMDAHQAVSQLKILLNKASQNQTLVQKYAAEIDELNVSILEARTSLAGIDEQIVALRKMAGSETEEELNEAERRSEEFLKLKERLEVVEETLASIAEGLSLNALEEQARKIDPDDLPGRIDTLANEIEVRIDPEILQLSEAIGREKNELARMDGSGKAAELADVSQQVLAKIRRLTERYIRVKLATKILREEIERYRAENQDPVLKIASRYFHELTLGSFAGLRTDSDDHEQPILIGVRPNGAWIHVEGMSSGTRDQLYLALRLATLEWRIQSSEPMPFIVDDILINFDDERSLATLQSLAALAEKTQVILFTHHAQIATAAQSLKLKDKVFIHQL